MAVGAIEKPFVWGKGGRVMSPEEIAREREIAEALAAQGADYSPVDHWMQGLARVAHAGAGAFRNYRANKAERGNAEWNSDQMRTVADYLGAGVTPDPVAAALASGPSPSSPAGGSRAASALPVSFLAGVDRTEGGGDYNTLYGHAQRPGRTFAGTNVSDMTIGQALAFASPSGAYGQSVKGQIGRVATPMGRHQIVGKTLRAAAQEMGLSMDTPFNAQTQDAIALHLAKKRIAGASTLDGKINALRSEWHGFKNVPRAQMAQIVADLENTSATPLRSQDRAQTVGGTQVASLDPSIGVPDAPQMAASQSPVSEALMMDQLLQITPPQMSTDMSDAPVAPIQARFGPEPMNRVDPLPMAPTGPQMGAIQTGVDPMAMQESPVALALAQGMSPEQAEVVAAASGAPQASAPPVDHRWPQDALHPQTARPAPLPPVSGDFRWPQDALHPEAATPSAYAAPQPPIPSPEVAQALAPAQVAQAGPAFDPRILEMLTDPRANAQTRQIGAMLFQDMLAQRNAQQERALAEQQAAAEMERRRQAATAAGIDPSYASDPELWKGAAGQHFRDPARTTIDGRLIDSNTGQVIQDYGQRPTGNMQEYEAYANYERENGRQPLGPLEYEQALRKSGATSINNILGGERLTPGQKKIDEAFADTYLQWQGGGYADAAKQIDQLNEALGIIDEASRNGGNISGAIGALPSYLQPFINPQGTVAREAVEEVVQRSLREILGAQFTEREGERLIARAYNPLLPPPENAKRVRRLIGQVQGMAESRQEMVDYFDENGTLRGYKGRRPSLSQLENIESEWEREDGRSGRAPASPATNDVEELLRLYGD